MAKVESSYVLGYNRAHYWRKNIIQHTWAANQTFNDELSMLPAGKYLTGLYLIVEVDCEQDGNGSDAITTMQILDIIRRMTLTDAYGKMLDLDAIQMAQNYKLETGHNCILPDPVGASSGGSEVHSFRKFIIPFYFAQWRAIRPFDFAYPTTLLQDANLSIACNADTLTAGHASSNVDEARINIVAECVDLSIAQIPPTPEVAFQTNTDMSWYLGRGNYQHVLLSGFAKGDLLAFENISVDADGMVCVPNERPDFLAEIASLSMEYCADNLQMVFEDQITGTDDDEVNDKDIPIQDENSLDIDRQYLPIYYPENHWKLSHLLRVENRLNFQLGGTAHEKTTVYRRYRNHTASEIESKARVMGFGPETAMPSRTARRKLTGEDLSLRNILPVKLVKPSEVG